MSQQTPPSGCVGCTGGDKWAGTCLAGFQSLVTGCVKILLCAHENALAWKRCNDIRDEKDDAWTLQPFTVKCSTVNINFPHK